jgi:hypothetical protein
MRRPGSSLTPLRSVLVSPSNPDTTWGVQGGGSAFIDGDGSDSEISADLGGGVGWRSARCARPAESVLPVRCPEVEESTDAVGLHVSATATELEGRRDWAHGVT